MWARYWSPTYKFVLMGYFNPYRITRQNVQWTCWLEWDHTGWKYVRSGQALIGQALTGLSLAFELLLSLILAYGLSNTIVFGLACVCLKFGLVACLRACVT
jgi:hypothetical protein